MPHEEPNISDETKEEIKAAIKDEGSNEVHEKV